MNDLWHGTIRHTVTVLAIAAVSLVAFFFLMGRIAPPTSPIHSPVAVFSPSPLEHELQAAIEADAAIAASRNGGSAPLLLQPAVSVIEKTGAVGGLSGAQIAQILGALKPKTMEKLSVGSRLAGPSPAPTPSDPVYQNVYNAAYSADTHALKDTTLKTDVTITREEIAPSRVGSLVSAAGSGLSFSFYRHKQYEIDLAAVLRDQHVSPTGCAGYLIPHTSLSLDLCAIYDKRVIPAAAAVIHF